MCYAFFFYLQITKNMALGKVSVYTSLEEIRQNSACCKDNCVYVLK